MDSARIHNFFSAKDIPVSPDEANSLSEYWTQMKRLRDSLTEFPFADAEVATTFVSRTRRP